MAVHLDMDVKGMFSLHRPNDKGNAIREFDVAASCDVYFVSEGSKELHGIWKYDAASKCISQVTSPWPYDQGIKCTSRRVGDMSHSEAEF
jgi:hypothetical protein